MSHWLIAITGVIYLVVSAEQFAKGGVGQGIMYFGYALANVGAYMLAK